MGWGGRWEGGSGWGTHVNPWLIYVNVWQKPLQCCKAISLQLIKINEKKKKPRFLNTEVRTKIPGTPYILSTGMLLPPHESLIGSEQSERGKYH